MDIKQFLEKSSLYVKYKTKLEDDLGKLKFPSINLFCTYCDLDQTFTFKTACNENIPIVTVRTRVGPYTPTPIAGEIILIQYLCAGCGHFRRYFLIEISERLDYMRKVGQFPEFDIIVERNIKKMLGPDEYLFKKGRICESQGYGIAAFAYYRRIIEIITDDLLNKIWSLLTPIEKTKFNSKFEKIKESKRFEDKLNIAQAILPQSLLLGGVNPVKILYERLSEGIHKKDDEECVTLAEDIRDVLVPLINQVITTIESQRTLNESAKKLLKRGK